MDYKVFIMNKEKKLVNVGDINNVSSFNEAQSICRKNNRNKKIGTFLLVRYENILKVKT